MCWFITDKSEKVALLSGYIPFHTDLGYAVKQTCVIAV